ncbi:MAG: PIG-L family deacetylase [Schleiferiaceae bacterium]|nr:PIG-L family deacetylase [Schleiferiaceae bacterium]MDP4749578.1 PIG-L family deacetylase [Schleiferiaceae bacterium]
MSKIAFRRLVCTLLILSTLSAHSKGQGLQVPPLLQPQSSQDLIHTIEKLRQPLRVVYVAAHPDDENTRLLAYLAHGRKAEITYLSLTRGEGGQNLMGADVGKPLGYLREHELLAARYVDGAKQAFGSCADFGYSKTDTETWSKWNRELVLAETVQWLRTNRPHVVVTRFSPVPGNTHGHHTASAQMAVWASDSAASSTYRTDLGPAWRVSRVVWNTSSWFFASGGFDTTNLRWVDLGAWDPEVGESFGELAARSRSMHKSQGFGAAATRGFQKEYFSLLRGTWSHETDPFEVNAATPSVKSVGGLLDDCERFIRLKQTEKAMTIAEKAYRRRLLLSPAIEVHEQHLWTALLLGLWGVQLELRGPQYACSLEDLALEWRVLARVPGVSVHVPSGSIWNLEPNQLRKESITTAANANVWPVVVARSGIPLELTTHSYFVEVDPIEGERYSKTLFKDHYSVTFLLDKLVVPTNQSPQVRVALSSNAKPVQDSGWFVWRLSYQSAEDPLVKVVFTDSVAHTAGPYSSSLTLNLPPAPPAFAGTGTLTGQWKTANGTYANSWTDLDYRHLPRLGYATPVEAKWAVLLSLPVKRTVGVLNGSGDATQQALESLGHKVVLLNPGNCSALDLSQLDAVVVGVRAANVHKTEWVELEKNLLEFAASGKTVVVQYQTTADLPPSFLAPLNFKLSRNRMTQEDRSIATLAPQHPAVLFPYRLNDATWSGWVQERSLYHGQAERSISILSGADDSERPQTGLLECIPWGRGTVVYTGLSLFRQWPAGVPGAFQVLANLVELKQP